MCQPPAPAAAPGAGGAAQILTIRNEGYLLSLAPSRLVSDMRWFHRLWPRTLFGQLLLIMVSGTLVIQLMSSSIWFDVRFAQALEVPVRLVAARSAP